MIIYLASYLECIHDGSWATLSVHETRKGAEMATEHHKNECRKEYKETQEFCKREGITCTEFGETERWNIFEEKLQK